MPTSIQVFLLDNNIGLKDKQILYLCNTIKHMITSYIEIHSCPSDNFHIKDEANLKNRACR